jgi:hypothetical protein
MVGSEERFQYQHPHAPVLISAYRQMWDTAPYDMQMNSIRLLLAPGMSCQALHICTAPVTRQTLVRSWKLHLIKHRLSVSHVVSRDKTNLKTVTTALYQVSQESLQTNKPLQCAEVCFEIPCESFATSEQDRHFQKEKKLFHQHHCRDGC